MITGRVSSSLEAVIRLHISDGSGQTQAIDVVIDTGFSSFMSLPPATVANLGLKWIHGEYTRLADANFVPVDVYEAIVIWNGQPRTVNVQSIGVHFLIGMAMLAGNDLTMRVTDGGPIAIDSIP